MMAGRCLVTDRTGGRELVASDQTARWAELDAIAVTAAEVEWGNPGPIRTRYLWGCRIRFAEALRRRWPPAL